jgi:hypothetical protein
MPVGLEADPETPTTGNCEEYQIDGLGRYTGSTPLLTQSIVFARLPEQESTYLSEVQGYKPAESTKQIAGYTATVITYTEPFDSGPFPKGSLVYAYLLDLASEKTVFAAQLALPPPQLAQEATYKAALDTMMNSLVFKVASSCRNSTDMRCGPFFYSPQPDPKDPLHVSAVTVSPPQPVVGQSVTFSLDVTDSQDDSIVQNFVTYGDTSGYPSVAPSPLVFSADPFLSAVRYRNSSAPTAPQGEWSPPPASLGAQHVVDSNTFQSANTFTVTMQFDGTDTAATNQLADPYSNVSTCSFAVTILPDSSSAAATSSTEPSSTTITPSCKPS